MDERVRFDINEAEAIVVHFQVKSDLIDKIKTAWKRDDLLLRIKDEVL